MNKTDYIEQLVERAFNAGVDLGKNILVAILIYVIGRFLIKLINKFLLRIFERRQWEPSVQTFIASLVKILLNILLLFAIINQLGIETTSFAALLASAGVAVGMALSGNLSNFAGGIIVLIFKPYKVGDYIETSTASGTVQEIQIFHTILTTTDNKVIYVPNGVISSNAITNFNRQTNRRAEWVFGVEYGQNFDEAKKVIEKILHDEPRIHSAPAPMVVIKSLSDSSVDIMVRAWMKNKDYWDVYFLINKQVYETFNEKGIGFPFPQLTIHKGDA